MATNEEILLKVEVQATQAVKNIADLKLKVEELTSARAALVDGGKKFSDLTTEEQQQYVQLDQAIKAYNKEINENTRKVQNQIIAEQEYKDTLKGLGAELSLAKDKLRAMSLTDPKYKEQAAMVNALNERMKQLEEEYGVHTRSVGDYEKANLSLRGEIRQLTEQLGALKLAGQDNTEEYAAMSRRLAQMQDAMRDVSAQTNALASDTAKLDAATKSVGTMMGMFAVLNATMGETAKKDEDVQKTMKTLQASMLALTTLTQLQNNVQKQSILYQTAEKVLRKLRIKEEKEKAKAIAKTTAAQVAENAATTADAAAEGAATAATEAHTIAQKGLNKAMLANPVVLIIAGLVALAGAVFGVIKAISAFTSPSKAQRAEIDAMKASVDALNETFEKERSTMEALGASQEQLTAKRAADASAILGQAKATLAYMEAVGGSKKEIEEMRDRIAELEGDYKGAIQDVGNTLRAHDKAVHDARTGVDTEAEAIKAQFRGLQDAAREFYRTAEGQEYIIKWSVENTGNSQQALAKYNLALEKQMQDEIAALQKQRREERARAAKQAAEARANDEYNAAVKAMEAEAKIAEEQRKQRHASDAEEFTAKQELEKAKLELQRKYNKITEDEYQQALHLLAEQATTFAAEQAEAQAKLVQDALDSAIKLAGGKDLAGRLADVKAQYDEAEEAIKNNATLTAEEKNFYLAGLERQRTAAMQAERDKEGAAERKAAEDAKKAAAAAAKARAEELEKELLLAGNNARARYDIRKAFLEKELEQEGIAAEKKAEIEQKLAELRSEYDLARINAVHDYVGQATDALASMNEVLNNIQSKQTAALQGEYDKQKTSLDKKLAAGLISQRKYDKEVERMDADLAKKQNEIAVEQAKREKALSIFQIAVNTAAAIMKIWAEVPKADFGVSTGILTALAAATGAAQIAAVASAPLPTARKGGRVEGPTHEAGGVLVNTEGDERIVAAAPSRAFPELLNLISYIGKHAGVPDGGFAARAAGITPAADGSNPEGLNADDLAARISEGVAAALRDNPPVMLWADFVAEQATRARIEDTARQ